METVVFWIAWGIISFWALKTFYFSFSKEKLERLKKAAFGINLSVLILTFLPWLPEKSGFILAFEGNVLAVLFFIFLVISIMLFSTASDATPNNKSQSLFKIASVATIANTLILFILMMQVRPKTFTLSLFDIAPIIAVLFLLVNNVMVLLLWQQLQLKLKPGKKR